MRYGRGAVPQGFLPVFSTDTEEEARAVIVATCSRNRDGTYYSHDLAREQSIDQLFHLSAKMERVYANIRTK